MTNIRILLVFIIVLPFWSFAAETEKSSTPKIETGKKIDEGEIVERVNATEPAKGSELAKASGKKLKEKTLSTAFEQFIPSEKISADNAVPFPVDI